MTTYESEDEIGESILLDRLNKIYNPDSSSRTLQHVENLE